MPSRRMIDPCFWMSETMACLTMRQRLLFIGLFSNADDQGRLRAHPALIRSMVFPYEDMPLDEIGNDLQALATAESIYLYEVESKPYLQIVNWWKYQSPQWAYPSNIPAPEGWHDRMRYRRDNEVLTDNWGTKDQEPLANALPKDLPNEDSQSDGWADRVSVRVSTSDSEQSADTPLPAPVLESIHPGILTFVHTTGKKVPSERWAHEIEQRVGPDPPSLERWQATIDGWVGMGWNPRNVQGMLDFYQRNQIPGKDGLRGRHRTGGGPPAQEPALITSFGDEPDLPGSGGYEPPGLGESQGGAAQDSGP